MNNKPISFIILKVIVMETGCIQSVQQECWHADPLNKKPQLGIISEQMLNTKQ